MHNIHFIKVEADNCQQAIDEIKSELSLENETADYFQLIGAYNLETPTDYVEDEYENRSPWSLISLLGENPDNFNNQAMAILNQDYKSVDELKSELIALLNSLNEDSIKSLLPWTIYYKAKELQACYEITDIKEQTKYENDWTEIGLTYFNNCGNSPTHLVLVDFHS